MAKGHQKSKTDCEGAKLSCCRSGMEMVQMRSVSEIDVARTSKSTEERKYRFHAHE